MKLHHILLWPVHPLQSHYITMPNVSTHTRTALTINMKHVAMNATMLGVLDFKVNTITCSINEICTLTTPTVKTLAEGTTTGTLQSGQGKRALTILVDISWEFDVPVLKEKQKSF